MYRPKSVSLCAVTGCEYYWHPPTSSNTFSNKIINRSQSIHSHVFLTNWVRFYLTWVILLGIEVRYLARL
jgi:hypothetical protein